jgi:lysophospholipase L1-like esterase
LKVPFRSACLFLLVFVAVSANTASNDLWVGTWACSPQLVDSSVAPPNPDFADTTLRQIVHVSAGGTQIRVRFSNAFGKAPLLITSAHVAKAAANGSIEPATDKPLTFAQQPSVTIPAGALLISDPLAFDLPPLSGLAVTLHIEGAPDGVTTHAGSRATSYFTAGDAATESTLPSPQAVDRWYFLNGVDVAVTKSPRAVVILGDSITDGKNSTTNGNTRWPDDLARRFQTNKHTRDIGVLNHGIGGNRLLHDGLGPNALARFDRDVLAQTGVHWLVVLEGVNDIGTCATNCNLDELTREILQAYRQIILRAHTHGLRVYAATILPFGGSFYATPATERTRQTINQWIRESGQFDAVLDFDAATRDARDPTHFSPSMDSGDHLHPSNAGYQVMADSINLKLFSK